MGAYNGQLAYEYINTGTYAIPIWTRVARVEDVDLPDERGGAELKTKESDDVKWIPGPRTRSVAFKYVKKLETDAVLTALKDAYENKTIVDYLALNQAATVDGAVGHRGPYHVSKFSEARPYEDKVAHDVEMKVADTNIPETSDVWEVEPVTMTAGAPA